MTSSVRTSAASVSATQTEYPIIKALLGGTSAMRQAGESLLPKWPNEDDESYKARLRVATLYPAFGYTVMVMAGKPFSKQLQLSDDVPEQLREWCENIDLSGRNLHAFAAELMTDCLSYGASGVLVDYPKAEGIKTAEDEKKAGARPYFTRYAPGTVLGWKTKTGNGSETLTQLRLLETVIEEDGEFGEKQVEQVRVLTPGAWAVYRKADKKDEWIAHENGTTSIDFIPFVFFYGIRKGFGIGAPPLMELAHLNVEHWQSSSDQQTILHIARVPILTVIGADQNTKITVGASTAVQLPLGASMAFVEHSGAAIAAGRQSLEDLEEQMRSVGAELLVLQQGDMTATQTRSESEAAKCVLQRITEIFEDSLDLCLQYMAAWVKQPEGGYVELFKDFGAATLSDASAQLLLQANQSGKLSDKTLLGEWKRRGILAPDLEYEDEQERISEQGPALGTMSDADR